MSILKNNTNGLGSKENRGLDIGEILSAPLVAATSANNMMLREQTRFLMEYCFTREEGSNVLSPILIPLKMTRSVSEPSEDGKGTKLRTISSVFMIPLLTVIPLNSLSVHTVDVDFEMEVTNQTTVNETSENLSESKSNEAKDGLPKAKLYGKISYDSKEMNSRSSKGSSRAQNSSRLKVNIHAGQLPLPLGMTAVLDLYAKSIHPVNVEEDKKEKE